MLRERGLWPWQPGDGPRWWCEACDGSGTYALAAATPAVCPWCNPTPRSRNGHAADPPTLAALVAVASLGVEALRYAEGHARSIVGREPRIVFRVMSLEALREYHGNVIDTGTENHPIVLLASYVATYGADDDEVEYHRSEGDPEGANIVCDLVARGLHLVAIEGDRVTLAVEAL